MKSVPFNILFVTTIFSGTLLAEPIAVLAGSHGDVMVKRIGRDRFIEKPTLGVSLNNGDAIKVGPLSYASVMYINDKSVVKLRENTQLQLMDTQNTRTVDVDFGTTLSKVMKQGRSKTFRVQTPSSVASVKGTEFASIVDPISGVDQFIGKSGNFDVMNMASGQTVSVGPGQKAVSNAVGNLVQAPASPSEYPSDPETTAYEQGPKPSEREAPKKSTQPKPKQPTQTQSQPKKSTTPQENTKPDPEPETQSVDPDPKSESGNAPEPPKKPFGMGLGIGSATIDGVLYNQLALRPEVNIGKLGFGLDLVIYLDNEGNIRPDEWDIKNDPSMLLDKILYIRYGDKTDPAWIKYGSIEGMTLGYGGLMSGYSNMMEFPSVRRVGINTGFNLGPISGEIFLANVKDFSRGGTLIGFRTAYTISDDFPLSIGLNYVTDANMFSGLKDRDKDTYPDLFDDFPDDSTLWNDTDGDGFPDPGQGSTVPDSLIDIDADGDNIIDDSETVDDVLLKATPFSLQDNKASANGLTLDIGYPVLRSSIIDLTIYAEYNSLSFPASMAADSLSFNRPQRSGTGLSIPGIRSSLFGLLQMSLEYRVINGSYVPQFFDQSYDLNRVVAQSIAGTTIIQTKDMFVFSDSSETSSSKGLFGSASLDLFSLATFSASYANMKMDTTDYKSFYAFVNLNAENIPKLSTAMAYYQRNNDHNPFDFENPSVNTVMGYRIGYELSKGVSLIWDFRQYYRDDGTGKLEPIKQTTIETSFNF
ncbi:MAG: FecR domain-containing protein [Candidatus Neomarinimicrobiota bacterium]|nr:FecR domain-containing protein [Candidatus Neomarinimicrobiota bacterium]